MNNPLGSRLGAEGNANAGGAGAGAHSARRTLVADGASAAARDEAHARRPSAGAAAIADWRCGFRGGPSERIATRRGRTDRLSRFRKTENDFDFCK